MVKVSSSFNLNDSDVSKYTTSGITSFNNKSSGPVSIGGDLDKYTEDNENESNQYKFEITPEGRQELLNIGFYSDEIDKILDGEITIQDVVENIYKSEKRRKRIYENVFLNALKQKYPILASFECIDDIEKRITEIDEEILDITKNEDIAILNLIENMIKNNWNLETAINSPILWSYVDEHGNTFYEFDDKNYLNHAYNYRQYTLYSYKDLFGNDSEYINKLKTYLQTNPNGEQVWLYPQYSQEANDFITKLYAKKDSYKEKNSNLEKEKSELQAIVAALNEEIDYQIKYIDNYMMKEDFKENSGPNYEYDMLTEFLEKSTPESTLDSKNSSFFDNPGLSYHLIAGLIGRCLNDKSYYSENFYEPFRDGWKTSFMNKNGAVFHITDTTYGTFLSKWINTATDDEIQVYNYIYNTEGHRKALEYVEDISPKLDLKYVLQLIEKDSKWATDNKVIASSLNILLGWAYGLRAIGESLGSIINKDDLYLTNTYSTVDTYKQAITEYLAQDSEIVATLYSGGMTLVDSVIAGTFLRGIAGSEIVFTDITTKTLGPLGMSFLISGTFLGSKQYVTSLNNALLQGSPNGNAIYNALKDGAVETIWKGFAISAGSLQIFKSVNAFIKKSNDLRQIFSKTMSVASTKLTATVCRQATLNLINIVAIMVGESQFGEDDILIQRVVDCLTLDINDGTLIDLPDYIQSQINSGLTEDEAIEKAMNNFKDNIIKAIETALVYSGLDNKNDFDKSTYMISKMIAENPTFN